MKDFRAFILRGNVVDLAVGVVVGAAFGAVIKSLVDNLIRPLTSLFTGNNQFGEWPVTILGRAVIKPGLFVGDIVTFILVAAAVFFFVVRPVNALMARLKTEPEVESVTRECPHCQSSIPAAASVCAFCTRDIPSHKGAAPGVI